MPYLTPTQAVRPGSNTYGLHTTRLINHGVKDTLYLCSLINIGMDAIQSVFQYPEEFKRIDKNRLEHEELLDFIFFELSNGNNELELLNEFRYIIDDYLAKQVEIDDTFRRIEPNDLFTLLHSDPLDYEKPLRKRILSIQKKYIKMTQKCSVWLHVYSDKLSMVSTKSKDEIVGDIYDSDEAMTRFLNVFMSKYFPKIIRANIKDRLKDIATDDKYSTVHSNDESLRLSIFRDSLIDAAIDAVCPESYETLDKLIVQFLNHHEGLRLYVNASEVSGSMSWEPWLYIDNFIKFYEQNWDKRFKYENGHIYNLGQRKRIPKSIIACNFSLQGLINDYRYIEYAVKACEDELESDANFIARYILRESLKEAIENNKDDEIIPINIEFNHSDIPDFLLKVRQELDPSDSASYPDTEKLNKYLRGQCFNIIAALDNLCVRFSLKFFVSNIDILQPSKNKYSWNISISRNIANQVLSVLSADDEIAEKRCDCFRDGTSGEDIIEAMSYIENILMYYIAIHLQGEIKVTGEIDSDINNAKKTISNNPNKFEDIVISLSDCTLDGKAREYLESFLQCTCGFTAIDENPAYFVPFVSLVNAYFKEREIIGSYQKQNGSEKMLLKPTTSGSLFKRYNIAKYQ